MKKRMGKLIGNYSGYQIRFQVLIMNIQAKVLSHLCSAWPTSCHIINSVAVHGRSYFEGNIVTKIVIRG